MLLPTVIQSLYSFEQFESRAADVLRCIGDNVLGLLRVITRYMCMNTWMWRYLKKGLLSIGEYSLLIQTKTLYLSSSAK